MTDAGARETGAARALLITGGAGALFGFRCALGNRGHHGFGEKALVCRLLGNARQCVHV